MRFAELVLWVKPRIRYITRSIAGLAVALALLRYVALVFAKDFPEIVSHYLHLTFQEAVVIAMFMVVIERVVIVQDLLEIHLNQTQSLVCYKNRSSAYEELADVIRRRANLVTKVDLVQFSGSTAIPILECVARDCQNAEIRLFLFDTRLANNFDDPGFHTARIAHTLTVVKTLHNELPHLKLAVWFYTSVPSFSAIVVDTWATSVGWYRVFPNEAVATNVTILGHSEPTVNFLDSAVEPLRSMVEKQIDAILPSARRVEWERTPAAPDLEPRPISAAETNSA